MATERIEIIVTERGSRTVKRNIEGVGKAGKTASAGMALLKRALLALGGIAIVRGLFRLADAFTNMQNRLRIVTDSTAQLNVVTQELFDIANSTRQSIESTAEVYARTALAVKELGRSQAETLRFTKSLNQAVTLSGASATEASAGMIQLSQGLASGALRGDELRSVLEQLPAVADVIAKGLGVTRGELRNMGLQGKITADIIFDAFAKAEDSLNEKFAKTIPTVGQAFVVLKNNVTQLTGEFFTNSGAADAIAQGIISIAEGLDGFINKFEDIADITVATFQIMRENFALILPFIEPIIKSFGESFTFSFRDILLGAAAMADALTGLFVGAANTIVTIFEGLPRAIKGIFDNVVRQISLTTLNGINRLIGKINNLPGVDLTDLFIEFDVGPASTAAEDFGKNVGDAFTTGFESSTTFSDFATDVLERADARKVERQAGRNTDILEGNKAREELNQAGEAPASIATLNTRKQLLLDIKGPQEELAKSQEQLNFLFKDGQITLQEYNRAMEELKVKSLEAGVTAADGFRRGFARIKADILDVSRAAENVLVNAFSSAEDALVSFVQTGEFSFSSFVDGILADLTKLLARQALTGLLNAFAGGGGAAGGIGGLLSSFGGAKADGGPVQAGRSFLVGERGPELFTPKTSGGITPNGGGAAPAVNVSVVNVQNEDDVPGGMESKEGDRVILNSLTRNRTAIRGALGLA